MDDYKEFSIGAMLPVVKPDQIIKKENPEKISEVEDITDEKSGIAKYAENLFNSLDLSINESEDEEMDESSLNVIQGYVFFEDTIDWTKESVDYGDLDEDIKDIIKTLNEKGYKTKYSCSGHPSGRFKRDRFRDGILHKKLYSTARIVFDGKYDFTKIPKYWELKVLDEDKIGIYVKPPSFKITDGLPTEAFNKWKQKYMYHLEKWVKDLPKNGEKKESEKDEEKSDTTLESVIDDLYIDTLD